MKRTSLTIRQSIQDKGRLWVPVIVRAEDDLLTIQGPDSTRTMRPRRVIWQEPTKFMISGLDEGIKSQRVLLRFETKEQADRACAALQEELTFALEPLPLPAEEFQVQVRAFYVFGLIYAAIFRFFLAGFICWITIILLLNGTIHLVGGFIGLLIISYFLIPGVLMLATMLRSYSALLRFDRRSMALRTKNGWDALPGPVEILWESSTSLIMRSRGSKRRFQFLSSTDATRSAQLIQEMFPSSRETNVELKSRPTE